MKKQVVVIHGGDTFGSYEQYLNFLQNFNIDLERFKSGKNDWKPGLNKKLGDDYEVFLPSMPNKTSAQYIEWKIWMDKIASLLNDEVILVGHSLGGTFLAKYLSENPFPKTIKGVFLVSAVFDNDSDGYSLYTFTLPETLDFQTKNVFLYHSDDDPVVPFSSLQKYKEELKNVPNLNTRELTGKKHINQEDFPELVNDIISL